MASTSKKKTTARHFRRFDVHQRIQHLLMLTSFLMLMVTGWPLRMAGVGGSRGIVDFFGGLEACGTVHRLSAIVMSISVVYHLAYIINLWRQKRLTLDIVPGKKDAADLVHNIKYFVGRRKAPPKFGRWSYIEKFDYWAVFWGVLIMVGSGIILWFPVFFASFLPAWTLTIAHVAHSDEALLAGLAIFIWHFYNVHLRRSVFPMNWVWLTGELTEEQMKHEHPLEYDEIISSKEQTASATVKTDDDDAEPTPADELVVDGVSFTVVQTPAGPILRQVEDAPADETEELADEGAPDLKATEDEGTDDEES